MLVRVGPTRVSIGTSFNPAYRDFEIPGSGSSKALIDHALVRRTVDFINALAHEL
jgi:hypothetical protein